MYFSTAGLEGYQIGDMEDLEADQGMDAYVQPDGQNKADAVGRILGEISEDSTANSKRMKMWESGDLVIVHES